MAGLSYKGPWALVIPLFPPAAHAMFTVFLNPITRQKLEVSAKPCILFTDNHLLCPVAAFLKFSPSVISVIATVT